VKSGRSRTLGCVGPKGGARVLDGLPGALLSWVWEGSVVFMFLPLGCEGLGCPNGRTFLRSRWDWWGEIVSLSA